MSGQRKWLVAVVACVAALSCNQGRTQGPLIRAEMDSSAPRTVQSSRMARLQTLCLSDGSWLLTGGMRSNAVSGEISMTAGQASAPSTGVVLAIDDMPATGIRRQCFPMEQSQSSAARARVASSWRLSRFLIPRAVRIADWRLRSDPTDSTYRDRVTRWPGPHCGRLGFGRPVSVQRPVVGSAKRCSEVLRGWFRCRSYWFSRRAVAGRGCPLCRAGSMPVGSRSQTSTYTIRTLSGSPPSARLKTGGWLPPTRLRRPPLRQLFRPLIPRMWR